MQTKILAGMLGSAAAVAALTTLVLLPENTTTSPTNLAANALVKPERDAPGAVRQGIAVRGHWNIEVRNPDGTVAERREFDNAFVGGAMMQQLLLRQKIMGQWLVFLHPAAVGSGACMASTAESCVIMEPHNLDPESGTTSYNLVTATTATGLRLSGTKVASRDGSIHRVVVAATLCGTSESAAACGAGTVTNISLESFSSHDFSAGQDINLVSGQQVLVSVELSFIAAN